MKTHFILMLVLSAIALTTKGQITITRADMPCPAPGCGADSVLYTTVPIVQNSIDVSTTGANTMWNVLPLQNGTAAYQSFYPLSQTPFEFQLIFFGSDYAQPLLGNQNVAGLPLSDAYEYYNYAGNNSRLEIKGLGAHITLQGNTLPLPAIYSSPDVLYRFPLNYGDTDSSDSGYSVDVPPGAPIATVKRAQKRVNYVDGWGSMTTPAGTFDVLRVRSEITRIDSIITPIFPIGVPSNIIEYKWIGNTKKIPVLQVTGNMVAANYTPTAITFWGVDPLGMSDNFTIDNGISIFPNPVTDHSTVRFSLSKQSDILIELFSITGSRVATFNFSKMPAGDHKEMLPMHLLQSGAYFLKCSTPSQTITASILKL